MDPSGEFSMGQHNLSQGLTQVRNLLESVHPVQTSEKNYLKNRELAEMAQLRKMQGIHAPIRFGHQGKRSIHFVTFFHQWDKDEIS